MPSKDVGGPPPLRLNTETHDSALPDTISSPRRARGYSLRTQLFNRNMNQRMDPPIELVNTSTQSPEDDGNHEEEISKISVSTEIYEDEESDYRYGEGSQSMQHEEHNKKKHTNPSRTSDLLPNYATLANRLTIKEQIRTKVKRTTTVAMDFILRRKYPPPSKGGRRIPIEVVDDHSIIDERTNARHIRNDITSSIYNPYNFLPRQILFQFSKIANV